MTFDVLVYKIITNYSGSWPSDMGSHTLAADNYIHVLLDDVTETFVVKYQASPDEGINILGTLSNGPNLFFGFDGAVTLMTAQPYYQWCDSTTLNKINVLNNFPYSFISSFPDAAECAIAPTCDMEFSSLYSTTVASGPSTPDGALTVSATSSNGTIKFSLDPDFDYATAGQTSGTFSGLLPGTYTIYAKDAIGCQDNITIEITVTTAYGVRHRLDFNDNVGISGKSIRVDIEERAYVGPIYDLCSDGDSPVKVRYEGDRDEASLGLVPSELILQVMVETQGQYTHLFQCDDRQFKIKLYVGDTSLTRELYWVGYIVPEWHSEPYLFEPYPLTVTATDQLAEFKNQDFEDINGNPFKGDLKIIKIIAELFKKTNLDLAIRCGINVYEETMDQTATDDPLDQLYVDSRIYEEMNCADVMRSFVECFRGQIFQSMGVWWIIRLSDAVGEFAYREFDINGDYVSNDTFDPVEDLGTPQEIQDTGGAMFAHRSQILSHLRNYGYFEITNDLRKDGNLIDEGRFEEQDIIDLGSGNKTFLNWNYLIGQPGATAGFEAVVNGDSLGAAFLDFTLANNAQNDSVWYSRIIPMNDHGAYRLKFQYLVAAHYNVPYIRIAWALKFHTVAGSHIWLSIGANGVLQYELVEVRNEIYVTEFGKWLDFEIYNELDLAIPTDSVQIFLFGHNHYGRDFADETAIRAFDLGAVENPNGFKRMLQGDIGETNIYTSSMGLITEDSFPDVIVPNNHSGAGRDWVWRLDQIINIGPNVSLVDRTKFDNVSLAFYPMVFSPITQFVEPQETLIYSKVENEFVKSDLKQTVLLGDMIRYDQELERNERNLYRSYLRFADGTPTRYWFRAEVAESKNLLQILLEDYIAQFSQPQRRLSGVKIANRIIHFVNCFRDTIDGTRYRPLTFEFDALNASYTPDMAGVVTGVGGDPPVDPGQFDCHAFSSAFKRGSCELVQEGVFDDTFDEKFN